MRFGWATRMRKFCLVLINALILFLILGMDRLLIWPTTNNPEIKNLLGNCIWLIERVQIDEIKIERTQIHFFYQRFHCRRRRRCTYCDHCKWPLLRSTTPPFVGYAFPESAVDRRKLRKESLRTWKYFSECDHFIFCSWSYKRVFLIMDDPALLGKLFDAWSFLLNLLFCMKRLYGLRWI